MRTLMLAISIVPYLSSGITARTWASSNAFWIQQKLPFFRIFVKFPATSQCDSKWTILIQLR
ncbi:hypothetical protein BMH32_08275 [Leucobacter sp. OLJS4]|nr:hypothetical protein BMH25_10445 [Leucobacter sp. OLCALW19]PII94422.1 hypothetical protein BMH27_00025 [Leucobacter sp. OLAS13]PIJ10734.1 hypothetical protein BMH32_08275 [Leucobacter sp. OLJS4]PIJ53584.1 hypothetical protein BMH30_02405 [Leucobacter sp. OLES1]